MSPVPRRSKPSWISAAGRRLIRQGSLAVVTVALLMLLAFVLAAVAVGGALDGRAPAADERAAEGDATYAGAATLDEKVARVDHAIQETLNRFSLSSPGTDFEVATTRTLAGRSFRYRYLAIPYSSDVDFARVVDAFVGRVADDGRQIRVLGSEFDSKTFQIQILIEGLPTHSMIFTRSGAEDDSGEDDVVADRYDKELPERLREGKPRLAVIIDDIGYREELDRKFLAIDAPITFSILPFTPGGREFAEIAHQKGRDVMLHMPMEPIDFPNKTPGRGALFMSDSPSEIADSLEMAMNAVPYAVGVNNHMGSRFTQSEDRMKIVLAKVSERGLFFVDSLTHIKSVGYPLAQQMSVPSAVRTLFLDNEPEFARVNERLAQLVSQAQRDGFSIGIGHPNKATLKALQTYLPNLPLRGVDVVPVSELVH